MPKHRTIGSAMTAFPYSIELDAHAASAKAMLQQFNIRHLPVREGDEIAGVITDRDLRRAQALGRDISSASNVRVADICTRDIYIVESGEPLDSVLMHMSQAHMDVACILKGRKLAGIYTVTDACRQFAELLRAQTK